MFNKLKDPFFKKINISENLIKWKFLTFFLRMNYKILIKISLKTFNHKNFKRYLRVFLNNINLILIIFKKLKIYFFQNWENIWECSAIKI